VVSAGQREPLVASPSIAAVGVPPATSAVFSLAGMPPAGLGSVSLDLANRLSPGAQDPRMLSSSLASKLPAKPLVVESATGA